MGRYLWASGAAAALLALGACDGAKKADTGASTSATPAGGAATAPATATGGGDATAIRIVGSSTVYPFTTAVAEAFKQRYAQFAAPIVESTGTGGGIKLFCDGAGPASPDIVDASRRMKKSEAEACAKNGVTNLVEIQIGIDGIVLAHAQTGTGYRLTEAQVYKALAATPFGKAQAAKMWKDVDPALPAQKIEVYGPPPTSGTRDAFAELVMDKGCATDAATKALKANDADKYKAVCTKLREDGGYVEAGENDNLIVQKLAANPNALGIFGYSYLEANGDKIKAVPIQGVVPTYETISTYKYPASRPLFIYVKGEHLDSKKGLREFVKAYAQDSTWGPKGSLIARGLIAAPDAVRAKNTAIAANMTKLDTAGLE